MAYVVSINDACCYGSCIRFTALCSSETFEIQVCFLHRWSLYLSPEMTKREFFEETAFLMCVLVINSNLLDFGYQIVLFL